MKIRNDDDLSCEIGSARVLMKILLSKFDEIEGNYNEHGWFAPDESAKNLYMFLNNYEEWLELIRTVFDKLDEADAYLAEKMGVPYNKKAANPHADQSKGLTANTTTGNGCQSQHTTKTEKAQGVAG